MSAWKNNWNQKGNIKTVSALFTSAGRATLGCVGREEILRTLIHSYASQQTPVA